VNQCLGVQIGAKTPPGQYRSRGSNASGRFAEIADSPIDRSMFENYGFFSPPRDPGGVERQVAAFEVGRDEKVSGDAP